jgi:hypothetical protein
VNFSKISRSQKEGKTTFRKSKKKSGTLNQSEHGFGQGIN